MKFFQSSEEREQAISLWHEAFGDSEEYINFFLDNHNACRALYEKTYGKISSMLFLIDGAVSTESETLPAFYLFAACTKKEFRGKGLMSKLLFRAEEYAKTQGREYIALVPAEESLFDYYVKYGYKTAFYIKEQPESAPLEEARSHFVWCNDHIDYIRAQSRRFNFEIIEKGENIFDVFDGRYIKAPVSSKENGEKYGMLLPLSEKAAAEMPHNAYIGLTLE